MNPTNRLLALAIACICSSAWALELTPDQSLRVGKKIWQNECAGTVDGLTSWNGGEDFASLGIGHFIWYPAGHRGPFEESFPELIAFLGERGVKMPAWLREARACPWGSRQEFRADFDGERLRSLRALLTETIGLQAEFATRRLEQALPKMLAAAPAAEHERIRQNFYRVAAEPDGPYALIDYVNFKGEGTLAIERYKGHGWGLLQVLEGMGPGPALPAFASSADRVLTLRVANSPPERHEAKWLPGWRNRLKTYAD